MGNLNLKNSTGVLFLNLTAINCSKHCDNEDYTRDSKPKTTITSDSLKVSSDHCHDET
jgi:hypothetical protein